jgi:hypothetical protein
MTEREMFSLATIFNEISCACYAEIGAEEQGSWGAGEQGSWGAGVPGSRGDVNEVPCEEICVSAASDSASFNMLTNIFLWINSRRRREGAKEREEKRSDHRTTDCGLD